MMFIETVAYCCQNRTKDQHCVIKTQCLSVKSAYFKGVKVMRGLYDTVLDVSGFSTIPPF